jgi:hypothetical protein
LQKIISYWSKKRNTLFNFILKSFSDPNKNHLINPEQPNAIQYQQKLVRLSLSSTIHGRQYNTKLQTIQSLPLHNLSDQSFSACSTNTRDAQIRKSYFISRFPQARLKDLKNDSPNGIIPYFFQN